MFLSKFQLAGLLLFLLGSCVLLPSNVEAQEVHALLVIMDADKKIGASVQTDEENVRNFLRKVDKVYNTDVTVLRSSAGDTTLSNIQREIRALRPGPDDVVFFFFAGHGAMVSGTKRTYLVVSDPASGSANLFRDDLEDAITAHDCRLQIIITDCCSSIPTSRSRNYSTFASPRPAGTKVIENLFGEHKGLLHVTSATEGQVAWGLPSRGGIFTESLIPAITKDSDIDSSGFLEWSEVLELAKKQTRNYWAELDIDRSKPKYKDPQIPRTYSLPDRMDGHHTEFQTDLWDMRNRYSDLDVTFRAEKSRYRRGDLLELTVRPDEDCYLTVLNWDPTGNLTQLFPNKYDAKNRLRGGQTYQFPPRGADYELYLGTSGMERLKIIAVTDKSTSDAISKVLSFSEDPDNPYRSHSVESSSSTGAQPRVDVNKAKKKFNKEKEIAKILLDSDDWTEAREEVEVR